MVVASVAMENARNGTNRAALHIAQTSAGLAGDLYHVLSRTDGNLCFSPILLHGLLYQGANGGTALVMAEVLGLQSAKTVAEGYKPLLKSLSGYPLALKIFAHQTKFRKEFQKRALHCFSCQPETLNFHSCNASSRIENWAKSRAKDKVALKLAKKVLRASVLIGVSVGYFNPVWDRAFSSKLTKKAGFWVTRKKIVMVKTMYQKNKFLYKHDEELNAQVLELPFDNFRFKMVVVLPFENSTIQDVEDLLKHLNPVQALQKHLQMKEVHLYLPKFKIKAQHQFRPFLDNMGLGKIFDDKSSNFTGLAQESKAHLDEIFQNVAIKIDERGGTKKGAEQLPVNGGHTSGMLQTVTFKVNRPAIFLVLFTDNESSYIVLQGRLSKPEYK